MATIEQPVKLEPNAKPVHETIVGLFEREAWSILKNIPNNGPKCHNFTEEERSDAKLQNVFNNLIVAHKALQHIPVTPNDHQSSADSGSYLGLVFSSITSFAFSAIINLAAFYGLTSYLYKKTPLDKKAIVVSAPITLFKFIVDIDNIYYNFESHNGINHQGEIMDHARTARDHMQLFLKFGYCPTEEQFQSFLLLKMDEKEKVGFVREFLEQGYEMTHEDIDIINKDQTLHNGVFENDDFI